jgi:hypothetical protein
MFSVPEGRAARHPQRRWLAVDAEPRSRKVNGPYLGLKAFQPEDAALFFGRAAKIQELNDRLRNGFGHDQRRNTDLL